MRFAIISDIHANLEALQETLQAVSEQSVDQVVCLGDIVGYHADPAECTRLLRDANVLCVAGSHDRAVAGLISTEGFSDTAAMAVGWTRKRLSTDIIDFLAGLPLQACVQNRFIAVHGALLPEGGCATTRLTTEESRRVSFNALKQHGSGARVCAFGHTHDLGVYELRDGVERTLSGDEIALRDDAYYLINPGAVGQPRRTRDRRATYFIFDTEHQTITMQRVIYNYAGAMAKARKAGLVRIYTGLPAPIPALLKWIARFLGIYGFVKRLTDAAQRQRRVLQR